MPFPREKKTKNFLRSDSLLLPGPTVFNKLNLTTTPSTCTNDAMHPRSKTMVLAIRLWAH